MSLSRIFILRNKKWTRLWLSSLWKLCDGDTLWGMWSRWTLSLLSLKIEFLCIIHQGRIIKKKKLSKNYINCNRIVKRIYTSKWIYACIGKPKTGHFTLFYFSIWFISSLKVAVVLLSNIYINYFEQDFINSGAAPPLHLSRNILL